MANLGLHLAMREKGINLVQTPVGDRYVLESMEDGGFSLGGEQSGHIVMSDFATTGDGLLTGLQLMGEMVRTGHSLEELASVVKRHPQVLVNVSGVDKSKVDTHPKVLEAAKAARDKLGEKGRVLLRASGTEPLIRVMVEAENEAIAQQVANELAAVVSNSLGSNR
jgi:phosphoglucosamine mutase